MQPQAPSNYDFILNPEKPQRGPVGISSMWQRIALVGGGLVLLLIIGTVVANLIKGSDTTKPALISLMKQQALLSKITDDAIHQDGISAANSNTASTINLVMGSEQQGLAQYAALNHYKISPKLLAPNTTQIDSNIQNAISGGTYNTTLHSTLVNEVTTYRAYLKRAYSSMKGPRGRALIQKDYDDAGLLLKQLETQST